MASATRSVVLAGRDEGLDFKETEGVEPITSFEEMGLKDGLLRGMYAYGFEKPTALQQRAIMPILEGKDVIAQGQSGSGKTSMIAITVCQLVDTSVTEVQALILSPKRKLAVHTQKLISAIGGNINMLPYTCRGGRRFHEDISKLEEGVHVVCGLPITVCHTIRMRRMSTTALKLLVLDEPAELFKEDIRLLFSLLPPQLQVVWVSATVPIAISRITSNFMTDPVEILLKRDVSVLQHIEQYFVEVERGDSKFCTLLGVLGAVTFSQAVIFCDTSQRVDWLAENLRSHKFSVSAIHHDKPKIERDASMSDFRDESTRVLIKNDFWTPRLNVPLDQVSLVINYDLPNYPEIYIRRIGRRGLTVYLVEMENEDINILRDIEKYYNNIRIGELPRKYSNTPLGELPMNDAADLI